MGMPSSIDLVNVNAFCNRQAKGSRGIWKGDEGKV